MKCLHGVWYDAIYQAVFQTVFAQSLTYGQIDRSEEDTLTEGKVWLRQIWFRPEKEPADAAGRSCRRTEL